MRPIFVLGSLLSMANAVPQAVTTELFPQPTGMPADCVMSWAGRFAIQVLSLAQLYEHLSFSELQLTVYSQMHDAAVSFASQAANGQIRIELQNSSPCSPSTNSSASYSGLANQLVPSISQSGTANQTFRRRKRDGAGNMNFAANSPTISVGSVCQTNGVLSLALTNSVLLDSQGRTGYLADNRQFQFDNPPQSGASVTAGFSVCKNGSLALGQSSIWWACSSGSFANLYDRNWAAQCSPVELKTVQVVDCSLDPDVVTAGTMNSSEIALLSALSNLSISLPSRTWGLPTEEITSTTLTTTGISLSSNQTFSSLVLITEDSAAATPVVNLSSTLTF